MSGRDKVRQFPPIKGIGALPTGGEPPDNSDMDARVSALEKFADEGRQRFVVVDAKLDVISDKLGHVSDEVKNFKWWMAGAVLTLVVTVIATGVGIQQMTVATFVAASQQANQAQPPAPQPIIIQVPQPAKP